MIEDKLISRVQIEQIMFAVDTTGITDPDERNEKRRIAVTEFLTNADTVQNYVMGEGEQELILRDLHSYPQWEQSDGE